MFVLIVCSHMKAAAATPGYKVMPNGSFKPISKGDEPVKPALIKPNVPKKKPVVMQPAYTKVSTPLFAAFTCFSWLLLCSQQEASQGCPICCCSSTCTISVCKDTFCVSLLQVAEVKKPEPAAAVPAGDFPPSLHSFVQRCFVDPAAGSDKTALQV